MFKSAHCHSGLTGELPVVFCRRDVPDGLKQAMVVVKSLEFLSQLEVEVGEQFDTVLDRWDSAKGFIGSMVVVSAQPVGGHVSDFPSRSRTRSGRSC